MTGMDAVHLGMLQRLLDAGVIVRHVVQHSWPGCDGMQFCTCPNPPYSYRVAPAFRDEIETAR